MAKTRQQKEQEVQNLISQLTDSKGAVLLSYDGLDVAELTALRSALREEGVTLTMIKKRLLNIVLAEAGIANVEPQDHDQNISIAISSSDEVAPAKVTAQFAKDHDSVSLRGGILEQAYIGADQVKALAKLPSKDELLAKLVGSLNSPLSGLVGVLNGNMREFVHVLNAIKEQKA
ncbi:MAG: 50S ribosomal protein L10 [Patescibacteria group bacterium]